MNNIKASKELISDKLEIIQKSHEIFAAPHSAFPTFLIGSSSSAHPRQGVIDLDEGQSIPLSLSTELAISHPPIPSIQQLQSSHMNISTDTINNIQVDEDIR